MKSINDISEFLDHSFGCAHHRAKEFLIRNGAKINQVLPLFSDEESRLLYGQEMVFCALSQVLHPGLAPYYAGLMTEHEFANIVKTMRSHKLFSLFEAPEDAHTDGIKAADMTATFILEQYRYKDIVKLEEGDVCLDGGAFIGDTALYFTESKPAKIYSFEIDKRNLACLKTNMANFGKTEIVEIVEKALGRHCSVMSYVPMQGNVSGGHISGKGNCEAEYEVPVTTIDAFCVDRDIVPNFIKMDIEGAEFDALEGARQTIQQYRPKLAVCIYHKMEHRWDIPLLLHELCPEYRLYLKKSQPYTETVLFATV